MLTPEGVTRIWELLAPECAVLRVSGGGATSEAPVAATEIVDGQLVVAADFDEQSGNHDWSKQEVVLKSGATLDADETDLGRKTSASTGRLTVKLRLAEA